MALVYILLTIIAIGVLLISEPGRMILKVVGSFLLGIIVLAAIGILIAIAWHLIVERNILNALTPVSRWLFFITAVGGILYGIYRAIVWMRENWF